MPLQAMQIVSLATQTAGQPGFASQAGQLLNSILSDLCKDYDFDLAKKVATIPLSSTSGPYTLPADYLRSIRDDVFFVLNGVPYPLVNVDLAEFDNQPQQTGIVAYPTMYATDMSQSPPVMYVWPPAIGQLPLTVRYFSQMPDIAQPEISAVVPWFPQQTYLIQRLSGELMKITDDERWESFLGDAPQYPNGAAVLLRNYLEMKDDSETRSKLVTLDKRFFRRGFSSLPATKIFGY